MINGEIKSNILSYKFKQEGIQNVYLISYEQLTNMSCLFSDCTSLKEIDLESFDTSQVTDMSDIFYNCSSLKKNQYIKFKYRKSEKYVIYVPQLFLNKRIRFIIF